MKPGLIFAGDFVFMVFALVIYTQPLPTLFSCLASMGITACRYNLNMTTNLIFYILFGYLCGSILFFDLYGRFFVHRDLAAEAADHNPGVFDAFHYGGFQAGVFVLIGDLAKGFLPVWLYLLFPAISFLEPIDSYIQYGLVLISVVVVCRMSLSKEVKDRLEVKLVWKH